MAETGNSAFQLPRLFWLIPKAMSLWIVYFLYRVFTIGSEVSFDSNVEQQIAFYKHQSHRQTELAHETLAVLIVGLVLMTATLIVTMLRYRSKLVVKTR